MEERNLINVTFVDSREIKEDEMDEDEDIEQDDEDFDFSADGLKTQVPQKQIVKMMISDTKQIVEVKCRLLWTWKWTQAVIELWDPKIQGAQQLINGTFNVIEYRLNPVSGPHAVSSISFFLSDLVKSKKRKSSDADNIDHESEMQCFNQCKADFCDWIKSTVCRDNSLSIKLEFLDDLLQKYLDEDPGERHAAVEMFRLKMKTEHAGHVLSLAVLRPTFFKASVILFPKKIISLLPDEKDDPKKTEKKEAILDILEKTTINNPWALGFSDVMYKATQCSGLEAPHLAISKTWFFPLLSNLHKNSLQLYDVFKTTCKEMGHTYLKANDLLMHLNFHNRNKQRTKKNTSSIKMTDDSSYKAVDFLTEQGVLRRQVKGSEERFHLMRYWKAEEEICTNFATIMLRPPWDLGVDVTLPEFSRLHDDKDQMLAARCIVTEHITMISGRGGTGKTEVVSAVLQAAEKGMKSEDDEAITKDQIPIEIKVSEDVPEVKNSTNGPILYCAPTGKAASVIQKRVGKKAFTIHQILASYKLWRAGEKASPWKFSTTRVVAIDECSMVSIELFSFLIKYLRADSRLQKVVLLGDHLQLPSVDPGNFMEDLYKAMITKGSVVNLKTNHRSEGSLIFNNATKISQQQMPIFDNEGCFRLLVPTSANLDDMPFNARNNCRKLANDAAKPMAIVSGISQSKKMAEDKEELYWALLRKHREEYKIDNDEKSQMIAFLNRECNALNQFGCFVYNKHLITSTEGRRTKKQFEIGDKVMCTKNYDIPVYLPINEMKPDQQEEMVGNENGAACVDGVYQEPIDIKLKETSERLMNGSVFKIRALCTRKVEKADPDENSQLTNVDVETDSTNENKPKQEKMVTYYVLDDMSGNLLRANQDLILKKCKLSHAWALSIHKFQGSEADSIVYGVSGSGYENWKHVYTAVTRGKKNVVIVGQYEDLKKAVSKRPIPRQTALAEKIRKMISDVSKEIEDQKKATKGKENKDENEDQKKVAKENEREIQKAMESLAIDEGEVNGEELDGGWFTDSFHCILSDDETPCATSAERGKDITVTPRNKKNVQIASEGSNANRNAILKPFLSQLKRHVEKNSPSTYSKHRENLANSTLDEDDSFNNLDLTGIEEEAIVASQSQHNTNAIEPQISVPWFQNSVPHVRDASKNLFNDDEDFEDETLDDCDEDVRRAMAMSMMEQTREQVEEREFEEAISNSQIQT